MNAPLQGTEEWALARCGRATASEFSSVLAKGQGKTRAAYMRRVLAERLTGKPTENVAHGSWAKNLERGHEQEPYAALAYEALTGNMVEPCGFIPHESLMSGCSPDCLVGSDGGAEIKSVIPTVQVETILAGGYPSEHKPQIQGCMWVTGRAWWDFCSYSPDLPDNLRLYVFRVERDDAYIKTLAAEVIVFLREVDALYKQLMERK